MHENRRVIQTNQSRGEYTRKILQAWSLENPILSFHNFSLLINSSWDMIGSNIWMGMINIDIGCRPILNDKLSITSWIMIGIG